MIKLNNYNSFKFDKFPSWDGIVPVNSLLYKYLFKIKKLYVLNIFFFKYYIVILILFFKYNNNNNN